MALADKLDTLAAHFAAGNIPSGSRDPYGLRRAGLEAVRAALFSWPDGGRRLDLRALLTKALAGAAAFAKRPAAEIAADLEAFLLERLRFVLASRGAENGQWSADEVEAVLGAREPDALGDPQVSLPRLLALHAVRSRNPDDFTALAAAFKRVNNILKQAGYARPWNYEKAFTEPAEKALAAALTAAVSNIKSSDDRAANLAILASLRPHVDRFFDEVMVMAEDPAVRRARLGLLGDLVEPFYRVGDISKLGGQG